MNLAESFKLKGRLQIFLNEECIFDDKNLIVDQGKAWAARMLGDQGKPIMKMQIGKNGNDPHVEDTAIDLVWEIPLTNPGGDVYVNTIEFIATAGVGMTGGVVEAGLCTEAGIMVARKAFPLVNKGPTDIMSFIWTLTVV